MLFLRISIPAGQSAAVSKCSVAQNKMQFPSYDRRAEMYNVLGRECFPCSLAVSKEVRRPPLHVAPLPSPSTLLEFAGGGEKQRYPWQEVT